MTIQQWLKKATQRLKSASVSTAQLDCEILLMDLLKKDRSWIHANGEFVLSENQLKLLNGQIKRRAKHEPIAYIRGLQEFYRREFKVSPATLTPRPETETMIEMLLKLLEEDDIVPHSIVDVGTGSGCIVISAKLEIDNLNPKKYKSVNYLGLDNSKLALKIAKQNTKNLNTDVNFRLFDLNKEKLSTFLPVDKKSIVLANLPYVPADFHINLAATREPPEAIFGGIDGLDLYRKMFKGLGESTVYVLTESMPPQHKKLTEIAINRGYKLIKTQDFIQLFVKSK